MHQRYALQPNLSVSLGNLAGQAGGGEGNSCPGQAPSSLLPPTPSASPLLPAMPSTASAPSIFLPGLSPAGSGVPTGTVSPITTPSPATQNGGALSTQPKFFVPGGVPATGGSSSSNVYAASSHWGQGSSKRRNRGSGQQQSAAEQERAGEDAHWQGPSLEPGPQSSSDDYHLQQQQQQQQHYGNGSADLQDGQQIVMVRQLGWRQPAACLHLPTPLMHPPSLLTHLPYLLLWSGERGGLAFHATLPCAVGKAMSGTSVAICTDHLCHTPKVP